MRSNAARMSHARPMPLSDFDHLAVAALRAARAAGVRPQLLLPEDQRRLALGDLDWRAAHTARIGGGGEAVLIGRAPVPPLLVIAIVKP